ncbi:MAG: hypothetical protein U5K51_16375 [Flavobacteriaceae bacterium]|nr:hypothetical protein [Flavobacteriaceae bacterium]
MKKIIYLIAFLPLLAFSQADESKILTTNEITVIHGHADHFKEGVNSGKTVMLLTKERTNGIFGKDNTAREQYLC